MNSASTSTIIKKLTKQRHLHIVERHDEDRHVEQAQRYYQQHGEGDDDDGDAHHQHLRKDFQGELTPALLLHSLLIIGTVAKRISKAHHGLCVIFMFLVASGRFFVFASSPSASKSYLNRIHRFVPSGMLSLMTASKSSWVPSSRRTAMGTAQLPPAKCSYLTTDASATHLHKPAATESFVCRRHSVP